MRKANILIRRLRRGEVGTFLLFVAIAFFFWIVQTAREESASDFIVKFYVEDQPAWPTTGSTTAWTPSVSISNDMPTYWATSASRLPSCSPC